MLEVFQSSRDGSHVVVGCRGVWHEVLTADEAQAFAEELCRLAAAARRKVAQDNQPDLFAVSEMLGR